MRHSKYHKSVERRDVVKFRALQDYRKLILLTHFEVSLYTATPLLTKCLLTYNGSYDTCYKSLKIPSKITVSCKTPISFRPTSLLQRKF